ncbi:MAG: 4Fe-4S dicluster domain-containing protein [Desulfobacterales bacterium]|nr:4Fe-4S dicluster domain-containing protein [Desulfobacterales bacterium]
MNLRIMDKGELKKFVQNLLAHYRVEGVVKNNGAYLYDTIDSPEQLCMDFDCTRYPPKKYFLPPRETLFHFSTSPELEVSPVFESPPQVIFGIHPYDLKAIAILDKVFSKDPPDPHYLKRREASFLIGVDPKRISPHSFWADMGAASVNEGFDLMFTDLEDSYAVEIGSASGETLISTYARTQPATGDEKSKRVTLRTNLYSKSLINGLDFPSYEIPKLLEHSKESPIWRENANKCLSCGACNFVCPTCYCFDVQDEMDLDLKQGTRYRKWDGCLLKDFAKVGSGENFRESRTARYRHRFYRKGLYQLDTLQDFACVGCGRCASACLADIADPVRVFKKLKQEYREGGK